MNANGIKQQPTKTIASERLIIQTIAASKPVPMKNTSWNTKDCKDW
jgi:hypothetical protein